MKQFKNKGFSAIELIVYMALLVAIGAVIGSLVYVGTTSYQRTQINTTLTQDLRSLEGIIRQKVANAIGVDSIATSSISLIMSDSAKNPTRIYLSGDSLWLQEGNDSPQLLTASSVLSVATSSTPIFSRVSPSFFAIHDFNNWAWNAAASSSGGGGSGGLGWIDFSPGLGKPYVSLTSPDQFGELRGLAYVVSHSNGLSGDQADGWVILSCVDLSAGTWGQYKFKLN